MAMSFSSPEFKKQAESLSGRAINSDTSQSRMALSSTSRDASASTNTNNATSNMSQSDRQSYANYNEGMANNPAFQAAQSNNQRDFRENSRQFDAGLNFKNNADIRASDTNKYGVDKNLEGNKYNADAGIKSTQIGADASKYSADKNAQANMYGADRNVDAARIGADANRFSALLGAGTATLNSQQYRPSFNR